MNRATVLAFSVAVLAASTPALAQDPAPLSTSWGPVSRQPSPRAWAFSLRAGRYRPDVDGEFTTKKPYATAFGSGGSWLFAGELERQIVQRFGTLSVGASGGYLRATGRAQREDGSAASADKTTLSVVPLGLGLTYRADFLKRWSAVIPYAKAGLDYALWSIGDGGGSSVARGGTAGWHAGAGLALMLDWLDPSGALGLDQETGVNHTYLFVEYVDTRLSGLGAARKLHLGDRTWYVGLTIEM